MPEYHTPALSHKVEARSILDTLARDGARFEIDILGEMRAATVRLEPLYDPRGLRLRS